MDGGNEAVGGPRLITEGEWAGWKTWSGLDPFEDQSGPFHFRQADGRTVCAFRAERRHMNGGGFMHGGCLMTFADFCLFALAQDPLGDSHAVTVSLNGEFLGPAQIGERVEATGEVTKAGGSLLFVRGLVGVEGRPVLNFSGVIKKIRRR